MKTANIEYISEGKRNIYLVAPSKIIIEPGFNVREDMGNLAELAESIRIEGVIVPLLIRRVADRFILVDGHRRLAAAKMAKESTVPVMMEAAGTGEAARLFAAFARNDGKPLTEKEQGEAFRRILGFGCKLKDIAKRTGRSVAYVEGCLAIAADPDLAGVSATTAAKVSKTPGAAKKLANAKKTKAGRVSASEAAAVTGSTKAPGKVVVRKTWQAWSGAAANRRELTDEERGFVRGLAFALGKEPALELGE